MKKRILRGHRILFLISFIVIGCAQNSSVELRNSKPSNSIIDGGNITVDPNDEIDLASGGDSEEIIDFKKDPNQLLDELDDEELNKFRSIEDIENPIIRELYTCELEKVYICHFPGSGDKSKTLCVNVGSQITKRNPLVLDSDGNVVNLGDYLGPCKHE